MTTNPNYNDGNWHGWNGGECPVHPRSKVEVVIKDLDGLVRSEMGNAVGFRWDYRDGCSNIISVRVVKEHREPREFWLIPGGSFTGGWAVYDHNPGRIDAIYVREVTKT